MNPEILEQLKDIHLAEPASWWPLAWGWWVLIVLVTMSVIFSIFVIIQFRRRRFAKRKGLKLLKQINPNDADWPIQLHQLLRRVCLSYYPTEQTASLFGEKWVSFLVAQTKREKENYTTMFHQLTQAQFTKTHEKIDFQQQIKTTEKWIRHCCPPPHGNASKEISDV